MVRSNLLKCLLFAFVPALALLSIAVVYARPAALPLVPLPNEADWLDQGMVLTGGSAGAWDELFSGLGPCGVVKKTGVFYLYYIGAQPGPRANDGGSPKNRALGVATSTDGVNFTKYAGNPIITHANAGNEEEGVFSCAALLDDNGDVVIYYGAIWAATATTGEVDTYVKRAVCPDGLNCTPDAGYVKQQVGKERWPDGVFKRADGTYHLYIGKGGNFAKVYHTQSSDGASFGSMPEVLSALEKIKRADGVVALDDTTSALFTYKDSPGRIEVYTLNPNSPTNLAFDRTYNFNVLASFFLDRDNDQWYMYYKAPVSTTSISLKTVGGGPPPPTPTPTPTPPPPHAWIDQPICDQGGVPVIGAGCPEGDPTQVGHVREQ